MCGVLIRPACGSADERSERLEDAIDAPERTAVVLDGIVIKNA